MKVSFFGKVSEGKLENAEDFQKYLAPFQGEVKISIEKRKYSRSTNQNSFYWLYLGIIADETGDNIDDLHQYFKRKFLPPRFITVQGKTIKIPATTTTLDKSQFSRYMEQICAMTGIPIPEIYLTSCSYNSNSMRSKN